MKWSLNPNVVAHCDCKEFENTREILIKTSKGTIKGFYDESHKLYNFRGVPYAAPPLGKLRFKRPTDHAPWTHVYDCKFYGKSSVQDPVRSIESLTRPKKDLVLGFLHQLVFGYGLNTNPFDPHPLHPQQDEDCLFLNICSPDISGKLPVAVWIHGGAYFMGSSSEGIYGHRWGHPLAKENMVVVTINYRLGALGFLKVADGDYNCGLWDQTKALEWVHQEIAKFGGDPDNITVFGESAGSMSIGCLISSPIASKYIHRAIMQSGGLQATTMEAASHVAEQVAKALEIKDLDDMTIKQLSRFGPAAIYAAQSKARIHGDIGPMPFQPVIDGEFLPESPLEAVKNGSAAHIDLIVGYNKDEWNLFTHLVTPVSYMPRFMAKRVFKDLVGHTLAENHDDAHDVTHQLMGYYEDEHRERHGSIDWLQVNNQMLTDAIFAGPAHILAEEHAAVANTGVNTFMYRFDYCNHLGAVHGLELAFLHGTLDRTDLPIRAYVANGDVTFNNALKLARLMSRCWASFMRSGDPSHGELLWPSFADTECQMIFESHDKCTVSYGSESTNERGIDHLKRMRRRKSSSAFGSKYYGDSEERGRSASEGDATNHKQHGIHDQMPQEHTTRIKG